MYYECKRCYGPVKCTLCGRFIRSRILFEVWSNHLNVSNLSEAEVGHKFKCNHSYKSKTHINTPGAFLCRICAPEIKKKTTRKTSSLTQNPNCALKYDEKSL